MRFLNWPSVLLVTLPVITSACGGSGGGDRGVAADSVALSEALLTPETFDTVTWASDSAAVNRGGVVWSYSCQKCHGSWADGDGGFVLRGDTVRPPSFRKPDWRYADDAAGMRRQVFVGTSEGMPHWGMEGLRPRDIVAVTMYVQQVLLR